MIRITAGQQEAITSKSSKGIFQDSLNMSVQQGTQDLVIDLITESKVVLAQLKLNVEKDILGAKSIAKSSQEKVWPMKERSKECPLNPVVRLTFSITGERDLEDPLMNSMLQGKDPETIMLMQQQL